MVRRARREMIEETRGKLIASARQAFAEHGYAETAMDDFTASVALTRGALYHHFGDKKGLLRAVVETLDREMDRRLDAASDAAPDLWSGFVRRCHLYLEMALEPEVQRIVLRDAPSVLGSDYALESQRACLTALAERLAKLKAEGTIKPIDPAPLARLINGALVDAALWIVEEPAQDDRLHMATRNLDALLSGLRSTA